MTGIINLDTEKAKEFGFTSDKYIGYLWDSGNNLITISVIMTIHKGQGHLTELIDNITKKGYKIQVPTPSPKMQQILQKKGFIKKQVYDKFFEDLIEIMTNEGNQCQK